MLCGTSEDTQAVGSQGRGRWASQAAAAAASAQCSPLYPPENVMKARKGISDPQIGSDLSRSCPITLLTGAWTSKALGEGSSCSVTQRPFEDEAVDSHTP